MSEIAGVVEAKWSALGLTAFYAKPEPDPKAGFVRSTPSREDLLSHTPQLSFHGHNGYSLGRYTELFVFPSRFQYLDDDDRPESFNFKMGTIEGSLGQATPLAHSLFDGGHNEDYDGSFSSFFSLRLSGVTKENAEVMGLSAMLLIGKEHGIPLRPMRAGDFNWADEDAEPPANGADDDESTGEQNDSPGTHGRAHRVHRRAPHDGQRRDTLDPLGWRPGTQRNCSHPGGSTRPRSRSRCMRS